MKRKNIAGLIAIVAVVAVAMFVGCIEEETKSPSMTVEEIKSSALTISYDDLMRNNENYIGKIVYYRGKVVQVRESYSNNYVLRVATKQEPYIGYFGDVIWINYKGKRLLEDDIIDIWGGVKGLETYRAVLGNEITIPEIDSLHVESVTKAGGETAKPTGQSEKVTDESKQMELIDTAVSASVMTMTKNWDADAEDDGIVVYPDLKDSSGESVKFEGIELPVDIKIYTTKYTQDFKEVKDRLVYSGTATIDSWKDGNFLLEGGIKIPFESINAVGSDKDYGWVYTTITLPDGRTIEARDEFARIKPE